MGTTATILSISFTITCAVGIAFVLYIARSTRQRGALEPDRASLAEREKAWFVVVTAVLVALLVATIWFTPYGRSESANATVLKIRSIQFAWLIPNTRIEAGRPIEFELTSDDVNHDFAVYTMSGTLLFEVQVMPGYTTRYSYTFKRPGTYRVLCLEYCGVGHAQMQDTLTVSA
ncbi:MAG TPA: hypothetical protein VFB42_06495 [Gaiellaceae bacterium]|nr:hypothetical protein [Gaiellaceae bacterium]